VHKAGETNLVKSRKSATTKFGTLGQARCWGFTWPFQIHWICLPSRPLYVDLAFCRVHQWLVALDWSGIAKVLHCSFCGVEVFFCSRVGFTSVSLLHWFHVVNVYFLNELHSSSSMDLLFDCFVWIRIWVTCLWISEVGEGSSGACSRRFLDHFWSQWIWVLSAMLVYDRLNPTWSRQSTSICTWQDFNFGHGL